MFMKIIRSIETLSGFLLGCLVIATPVLNTCVCILVIVVGAAIAWATLNASS